MNSKKQERSIYYTRILNESINNNHSKIYWLVIVILLVKLALLPFAQTVNADAVSRVYASIGWMENPSWITKSVWGPFYFYIHGAGLLIWNNSIIMPKIITVLFSVFTLIPFYFFTKRTFNDNGAIIATVFLAISPILFRNSFMPLSEIPYLFFLTLTLNFLSKGIKENSNFYILLAGLTISFASGIRYEAWIIIAVLSGIILLLKRWKFIFLFNITALIFPCYWLFSNWLETGNPLYSIQGTYNWSLVVMDNNHNLNFENYLRRIWYFPFSWVIAVGIPTGFIALKTIFKSYSKKSRNQIYILYSIPFIVMIMFYEYNTFKGVLLTQHRYIGTLVILSLPFIAPYFKELTVNKIKQAFLYGSLTIILSFVYNSSGIIPLPRLENQSTVKISQVINKNINDSSCLILDFIGWDNTYFIALHSKLSQEKITITEGAKNSKIPIGDIKNKFENFKTGIVLLKKDSDLFKLFFKEKVSIFGNQVEFKELYETQEVTLFYWDKNNL